MVTLAIMPNPKNNSKDISVKSNNFPMVEEKPKVLLKKYDVLKKSSIFIAAETKNTTTIKYLNNSIKNVFLSCT